MAGEVFYIALFCSIIAGNRPTAASTCFCRSPAPARGSDAWQVRVVVTPQFYNGQYLLWNACDLPRAARECF
jgi:hypothetical protein